MDMKTEFKPNPELRWYKDPSSKINLSKKYLLADSAILKHLGEKTYYEVDLVKQGLWLILFYSMKV